MGQQNNSESEFTGNNDLSKLNKWDKKNKKSNKYIQLFYFNNIDFFCRIYKIFKQTFII